MPMPSGYKRLEYIRSSGTQYVDTGFQPNQDTRVFCDAVFAASSTAYWLFGARNGNQDRTFGFLTYDNQYRSDYNTSTNEYLTEVQSGRFTVDKDGNVTKINGETAKTATAGTFQCTHNLYLLANNNNGTVGGQCSATLYACQIYDDGTLIRDYIPCQTAGGEVGLWDDVNSVFCGNAGTGTFIAGPISSIGKTPKLNCNIDGSIRSIKKAYGKVNNAWVHLKAGYRKAQKTWGGGNFLDQLEYIESTGTQYIDLGFIPNQDTSIEIITTPTSIAEAAPGVGFILYGSGVSYLTNSFELYTSNNSFEFNYANQNCFIGSPVVGHKYYIYHNKNQITVKDLTNNTTVTHTFNYSNYTTPYTLCLFALHRSSILCGNEKIHSCKVYDNNIIIRNLIPNRQDSGSIGLWDLVNEVFYPNLGTGSFIAGPSV